MEKDHGLIKTSNQKSFYGMEYFFDVNNQRKEGEL